MMFRPSITPGPERFLATLSLAERARLEANRRQVVGLLEGAGFSQADIRKGVQTDLDDVYERRSAACPYEQLRCARLLHRHFGGRKGGLFLTVGRPLQRVPIGAIDEISVERVFRHWRSSCEQLTKGGVDFSGFAIFELSVIDLGGERFWEPHYHAALWCDDPVAAGRAFRARRLAGDGRRKRAVHRKAIYDTSGVLGYMAKFQANANSQYTSDDGGIRTRPTQMTSHERELWLTFMSRHPIGDLLTMSGDAMPELRQSRKAELAMPRQNMAPSRPLGRSARGLRGRTR